MRHSMIMNTAIAPTWLADGDSAGNCIAAFNFKGASSKAYALTDLTGGGKNLTEGNSGSPCTWSTTLGVGQSAGANSFLVSSIIPPYPPIFTAIVRFSNFSGTGALLGLYGTVSGQSVLYRIYPWKVSYSAWSDVTLNVTPGLSSGVLAISGTTAYRNGVAENGTVPMKAGSFQNANGSGIALMCELYNSTGYNIMSGNIQAAWFYSVNKTAAQIAALTTAMNAL